MYHETTGNLRLISDGFILGERNQLGRKQQKPGELSGVWSYIPTKAVPQFAAKLGLPRVLRLWRL